MIILILIIVLLSFIHFQYIYCLSPSLLKIKSLKELAIIRKIIESNENDLISEKGFNAIQNGLSAVQRIQLQLDRSDGRPASITTGFIANKYSMLISSCLRTQIEDNDKKTWLAVLGPLEYVGFRMKDIIKSENSYILDSPLMITKMKQILLDITSSDEDPIMNKKDEASAEEIRNLSVLLARCALRYTIYIDQFEESKKQLDIKMIYNDFLTSEIFEAILTLDLKIPYIINQSSSTINIKYQDISNWKENNKI